MFQSKNTTKTSRNKHFSGSFLNIFMETVAHKGSKKQKSTMLSVICDLDISGQIHDSVLSYL